MLVSCGANSQVKQVKSSELANNSKIPERSVPRSLTFSERQLKKAEAFYRQGKLLHPKEDNAYIRYRAVQILEPGNQDAKTGLDGILIHEVNLVKDLLASSKLRATEKKISELQALFPSSHKIRELRVSLDEALARQREINGVSARESSGRANSSKTKPDDRIYLDKKSLSSREEDIVSTLRNLAKEVALSGQGVLIYARNDAEGRWIYQQMRKATPDYRIRGDIRIGDPAIRLLSPYEE